MGCLGYGDLVRVFVPQLQGAEVGVGEVGFFRGDAFAHSLTEDVKAGEARLPQDLAQHDDVGQAGKPFVLGHLGM